MVLQTSLNRTCFKLVLTGLVFIADKDPGLPREKLPDPKKAEENFDKACQGDIGEACNRLANMYIAGFKGAVEVRNVHFGVQGSCRGKGPSINYVQ